jgi:hypothetical protein
LDLVLVQQKVALAECETALHEAEDSVKRCAVERRELKVCAKKCFAAEQEALERARRLVDEQGERRRAAQTVVAELNAEEQENRVHTFHLEHRSPNVPVEDVGETSAAFDIHQYYGAKSGQLQTMKEEEEGDEEEEEDGVVVRGSHRCTFPTC